MLSGKFAETKLKNDLVSVIGIHFRRYVRGLLARAPFLNRIEQCLVIRPFNFSSQSDIFWESNKARVALRLVSLGV